MILRILLVFLVLSLVGPLWVWWAQKVELRADWRTADRTSAQIAPDPVTHPEAIVQVYAARAFNWRGLFGVHSWLAVKPKGANVYTTYQVIGWRALQQLPVLVIQQDSPDRNWFGQRPRVIKEVRGEKAEEVIPAIQQAIKKYPYVKRYHFWPGPNSNTFVAYVARHVPRLHLMMPAIAIGKDYLGLGTFFARAPSGTGYQFALFGMFGLLVAKDEGIELNLLGLVFGVNPWRLFVALPGVGRIGFV